ncbi:hypothetical protein C2G38_2089916 [Gigaspora rosea]|uniref:Uncharacterized protein n=1 Tax=Gigaspora rosea TaxID=44941 RepID=A0A397V331_9GLOM|nr:hypothetical protein C2G38_2089916 [Gigaspora rosea]
MDYEKFREWISLNIFEKRYYNTSMNSIINLLLKLFIESGATLDKLVVFF